MMSTKRGNQEVCAAEKQVYPLISINTLPSTLPKPPELIGHFELLVFFKNIFCLLLVLGPPL